MLVKLESCGRVWARGGWCNTTSPTHAYAAASPTTSAPHYTTTTRAGERKRMATTGFKIFCRMKPCLLRLLPHSCLVRLAVDRPFDSLALTFRRAAGTEFASSQLFTPPHIYTYLCIVLFLDHRCRPGQDSVHRAVGINLLQIIIFRRRRGSQTDKTAILD